jgi:ribosomal protein S18 acetylase RimI-like enzyme
MFLVPRIRGATPKDNKELLSLFDIASGGFVYQVFAQTAPRGVPVEDYIIARMGSSDSGLSYANLWVCEVDGEVAGLIALEKTADKDELVSPDNQGMFQPIIELTNMAPGCCNINLLATFPKFRGRKAGLALMEFAETQRGANGLSLTVGDTNLAAQGFYQHLGFRFVAHGNNYFHQ